MNTKLPSTPFAGQDDRAFQEYTQHRRAHWDAVAVNAPPNGLSRDHYHRHLARIYRHFIPSGSRVLEMGCGQGGLLAAVSPSEGWGVDFSPAMLDKARAKHPELHFRLGDAHNLAAVADLNGQFDAIILSDLINDLWDVQATLEALHPYCTPNTRLIFNYYSLLWEKPLALAGRLGWATPRLRQNWFTPHDAANLIQLAGFEAIRTWEEYLLPLPLLGAPCNRYLARLWPLSHLCLCHFTLARPKPTPPAPRPEPTVTVLVPARNEAGNIENIFARVPEMGAGTELLFVEGNSTDNTFDAITEAIAAHPERNARLIKQPGKGKGDAVRAGFAQASGQVLMILDADLTVPPECLPRFYAVLRSGEGEFVNGVRLVYPMEDRAMRFLNLLGNKFFSLAFTWLLGQPIKDSLCGTKVLTKENYERIVANRRYFGDFDPFGDFDLIFGAAKLNLKIVDLPIRYRERTYGETNISRWRHGLLLLKMVVFAAGRIKFI